MGGWSLTEETGQVGILVPDELCVFSQSKDDRARQTLLVCELHAVGKHEEWLGSDALAFVSSPEGTYHQLAHIVNSHVNLPPQTLVLHFSELALLLDVTLCLVQALLSVFSRRDYDLDA